MTAPAHRIDRLPLAGCQHPIEVRVPLRIIDILSPDHRPNTPAAGDRATAEPILPRFHGLPPSRTHSRIVLPSPDDRRERKRLAAADQFTRGHGRRS